MMCSSGLLSEMCDSLMAGVDVVPSGWQLPNAYIPGYSSSGGSIFKKVISGGGPCVFRECPGAEYARRSGSSASSMGMLAGGIRSGGIFRSLWKSLFTVAVNSLSLDISLKG